jgi:Ferritin-like domain
MRKIGGTTIRSIGHSAKLQRVADNDADFVTPEDMQAELREDDLQLTQRMRETDDICDEHGDVASASLLENWIDQVKGRTALNRGSNPPRLATRQLRLMRDCGDSLSESRQSETVASCVKVERELISLLSLPY